MRSSAGSVACAARLARGLATLAALAGVLLAAGCDNDPWPRGEAATNTMFSGVIENSPRHLDSTASYWSNDTTFTFQIYEPLYGYHYLKRPYVLTPKSAAR